MQVQSTDRLLRNVVSPCGLAAISYAVFLFACLIPPSVYSQYMGEPDLMFLDPATIIFYTLCVAAFIAGVFIIGWIFPTSFAEARSLETKISPMKFLVLPLIFGILVAIVSTIVLIVQVPGIFLLLMAQQGNDLKDALAYDVQGNFALAPLLLSAIIWWAYWRVPSLDLAGWRKRVVNILLVIAVLFVAVSATLTLLRSLLMLVLCGLAILYILRRAAKKKTNVKFILAGALAVFLAVSAVFIGFSALRDTSSTSDQAGALFGYTIASYNRLAAVVNGRLRYPYGGYGDYLSNVIVHTNRLPLKGMLHPPDSAEIWGSEFSAVSQAGLNGNLIWSGAFGYIFADLGWFAILFLFAYGLLYGVVWGWMKRGNIFGIVFYPFFGFCILFWLGTNYLFDTPMELILLAAVLLAGYEYLFVSQSHRRFLPAGAHA